MKFKIGGWQVSVEAIPPEVSAQYYHKDRDPEDMVDFVVVQTVEDGKVMYVKVYKDPSIRAARETTSISEFNKWYRKGR